MTVGEYNKAYLKAFPDAESFSDEKVARLKDSVDMTNIYPSAKPFNYQIPAIYALTRFNSVLLSDRPGLGKTFEVIAADSHIYANTLQ